MKKIAKHIILLCLILTPLIANAENVFTFNVNANALIPVSDRELFDNGFGANANLAWAFLPYLGVGLGAGYSSVATKGANDFTLLEGNFGPFFQYRFNDRFTLKAEADIGVYTIQYGEESINRLRFGGKLSGIFHLSPYISLAAYGGYTHYAYSEEPFIQVIQAGIGISLNLSEILSGKTRVSGEKTLQNMVFPASYAWYGANPVGTVRITNEETTAISEVNASFFLERYMSQPTVFAHIPRLAPGESVDLPITALFNESMLDLTENINANARITLDYRRLGARQNVGLPVDMPIYHRNAMSWDDDRRAASFVSSRDPAARYFASYMASVLEKRMHTGTPRNIQYALGLFEALRIYGIAYIIDPASSYIALSEDASIPDSLNYPYQTLYYRGGDCDDLSILFCSLLEVLQIDTAFITIPGHIYMAFDSGLTEEQAEESGIAGDLIVYEGKYWMPVEITIPQKGFFQAWKIGARQWKSAGEEALIFPMKESWRLYPPISVSDASSRTITLPSENALAGAFEDGMKIYERK